MKNEDQNFNTQLFNEEENLNIDQLFQSKNDFNNKDIILNDFDADLNISGIENIDKNENKTKNSKNIIPTENISIDKSFGDDFDNLNKINITNTEVNESSIQNIELDLNNENENKREKKIRTKDDLNNTPIPVFECLYCTNNKIVFQHFINEILSKKYLLQTSIYDINELDKLICNKRLINKDDKNEKLLNLVIKNTEYLKIYIPKEKSKIYFKSNIFFNLCQKNEIDHLRLLKQKIEDSIVRKKKDFYFKGINKIPRNSMNNKCLFNSTNSLINNYNALSGFVEPVQQINANNINNIKNNYTIVTCSNNSINFNSLSLNNNEFNSIKDNNNMLDYIVEKIEKNDDSVNYAEDKEEILDFFTFDLSRKINKKDLKWENKYYDIWNPDISSDFDENDNDENEFNIKSNNNINRSINNNINNKFLIKNKNINNSTGYINYNIPKKSNLIFTFNKNKDKKNNKIKFSEINKNSSNNINNNKKNEIINNNKNYSIKNNESTSSKEKDIKISQNTTNKSITTININKSHDLSKFSNKYINNYYNYNNNHNYSNNHKIFLSGASYMKSFGSTTNSSYNINKSANFVGKSRQKINYNMKKNNNINTKSLHYISNLKNTNNSSTNFSIGVSINLKANSSIKSNGIINCLNPEKISNFKINENKNIKNNTTTKYNNRKKVNKSLSKKNNLFNNFNNINKFDINLDRAKSHYNNKKISKSIDKTKYKNQNKKNNYNIYKKNNSNQQNIYNFSKDKQKGNRVISRTNDLLYSSNSIFNKINKDGLYNKSLGLSFGSNDYNLNENNTNIVFNSISNLNKSNTNLNISDHTNNINNSPNKVNKTYYLRYYNKNKKDIYNKINDLISLITNKNSNNTHQIFYYKKNNNNKIINFKNKSINCFNPTSSYINNHKCNKQKKNKF